MSSTSRSLRSGERDGDKLLQFRQNLDDVLAPAGERAGDKDLLVAIERGYDSFLELKETHADLLALDESEQIIQTQQGIKNFYPTDAVNPYVAVAAAGPWIVTLKGAVVYDCGGYGMLGFGHAPLAVLDAMNQPHAMANVMTPSISQ